MNEIMNIDWDESNALFEQWCQTGEAHAAFRNIDKEIEAETEELRKRLNPASLDELYKPFTI